MAIFVNRLTTATANDKDCHAVSVWSVNATSYDASAGEIALASPGPGFQLALTRLTICCGAAITATLPTRTMIRCSTGKLSQLEVANMSWKAITPKTRSIDFVFQKKESM